MNKLFATFTATVLALAITLGAAPAWSFSYIDPCGPSWSQPVTYYINSAGTSQISDTTGMHNVFHDSFDAWEEPCCSDFQAEYGGLTNDTALNTSRQVVLSFSDEGWPAGLGGPDAIAVALLEYTSQCEIFRAPVHFNSTHHHFTLSGQNTDLQSIATHEFGHVLGLGHSSTSQATMFASYVGGTSMRTLHDVDIAGVCDLYPGSCGCQSDGDCPSNEICENDRCVEGPCQSDAECPGEEICDGGDCVVLTCTSDSECGSGFFCQNGSCRTDCEVCRYCDAHSDCGSSGYCQPFPSGNRCLVTCDSQGQCPGDGECALFTDGTNDFNLCIAPTYSGEDYCPQSYTCIDTSVEPDGDSGSGDGDSGTGDSGSGDSGSGGDGDSSSSGDGDSGGDLDSDGLCGGVQCQSTEVCREGSCVEAVIDVPDRNTSDSPTSCATAPGSPGTGFIAIVLMLVVGTVRRRIGDR